MKRIANFRTTKAVDIFVDGKEETHVIDVTWYDNGDRVCLTDADNDPARRAMIIEAFEMLY